MTNLIIEPTSMAHWHKLVSEAQFKCNQNLNEDTESYLVYLLMRYLKRSDFINNIMSTKYLEGLQAMGHVRDSRLQDVGDQCLLFAGLFPQIAEKRSLNVSFFVDLGRSAYHEIAAYGVQIGDLLYQQLYQSFVVMIDILHHIRELNGSVSLSAFDSYDLSQNVASEKSQQKLDDFNNNGIVCIPGVSTKQ
ncbi:MAG: hypothetical protein HON94_03190 [Methylococcales bacterium]|jgi:hypothetical protein|nr:hypothetical protein [Methylococcales bacterium]MBT7410477.1 hypothetical protein [Methylococcales bacterium]